MRRWRIVNLNRKLKISLNDQKDYLNDGKGAAKNPSPLCPSNRRLRVPSSFKVEVVQQLAFKSNF